MLLPGDLVKRFRPHSGGKRRIRFKLFFMHIFKKIHAQSILSVKISVMKNLRPAPKQTFYSSADLNDIRRIFSCSGIYDRSESLQHRFVQFREFFPFVFSDENIFYIVFIYQRPYGLFIP